MRGTGAHAVGGAQTSVMQPPPAAPTTRVLPLAPLRKRTPGDPKSETGARLRPTACRPLPAAPCPLPVLTRPRGLLANAPSTVARAIAASPPCLSSRPQHAEYQAASKNAHVQCSPAAQGGSAMSRFPAVSFVRVALASPAPGIPW